jgi:hypothetical protein
LATAPAALSDSTRLLQNNPHPEQTDSIVKYYLGIQKTDPSVVTIQKTENKRKKILWVLYEMLQRKEQFFREIGIDEAHMATLHYGSKKNLEFEGETYGAPKFTPEQMQKANDARQWVLIYKHTLSCDELTQIELFIKNKFEQKVYWNKKLQKNVQSQKWTRDPKSKRRVDDFSYDACYYSKKKAQTIAWDTEATADVDFHKRYTSLLLSRARFKTI